MGQIHNENREMKAKLRELGVTGISVLQGWGICRAVAIWKGKEYQIDGRSPHNALHRLLNLITEESAAELKP